MIWLAIPLSIVGGYLYALRGGNHFRANKNGEKKSTNVNRLFYLLPTIGLLALVGASNGVPWHMVAGQSVIVVLTVLMGHGLFMDMGRYLGPLASREYEYPVSFLIGPENYSWPFWKRWTHNFAGMALTGVLRHSYIWLAYGHIPTLHIACYSALGVLHAVLYEAGHQMKHFNYLSAPENKLTIYGEHYVGALMWGALWALSM